MGLIRRHIPEVAWGAFALANLGLMVASQQWETIPFHLVWVSLTLLYGFRVWRLPTTFLVLAATCIGTAAALAYVVLKGQQGWDETTEVPLMAAMFLAMVWHAQRRERAAAAAAAARDREREFIRRASHELRTPITVAQGYAELIHHEEEDPVRRQEVAMILDELRRLSTLSERMLLLAAMEHAEAFLNREQVDLGRLLREVASRWSAATARMWRLSVRTQGAFSADRERLVAALDALIENAINATETGDSIAIEGDARDSTAVIRIVDSGAGIGEEDLPHMFDPFTRSARSRGGRRGTGLGLSIVRAVVEGHGGRVTVASRPGGPTTFELEMPGFSPHPKARRALRRSDAGPPSDGSPDQPSALSRL